MKAVAALGLFPHNVEDAVDELGSLGIVTLGPVVARAGLRCRGRASHGALEKKNDSADERRHRSPGGQQRGREAA